jgi:hypothetical protein
MSAILGLIGLGVFGASAVKCGIQDIDMMSSPSSYLDDGTPVYLDRKCNQYINGERVVYQEFFDKNVRTTKLIGTKSGKVYSDSHQKYLNKVKKENEEKRQQAINEGKLAYTKLYPRHTIPNNMTNSITDSRLTCECSTGKIIAKLECKEDGTCWKYYLTDLSYYDDNIFDEYSSQGYQITKEELQKLNVFPGSHWLRGEEYLYQKR